MKRLLSLLTAAALVLTLVPSGALATGDTPDQEDTPICVCTDKCTEGSVNSDCAVCTADPGACQGKEAAPVPQNQEEPKQDNPPETPVCTCTDKCAEGAVNSDCPVCGAVGADLTACKGPESQQGQPQQNENPPAEPEEPVCTCTAKCAEGAASGECPVCGAEGADLSACQGKEPEQPQVITITEWSWVVTADTPKLADGKLYLPSAITEANLAGITDTLPKSITANGQSIPVSWAYDWDTQTFTAALPEGYALAKGADPLTVETVDMGADTLDQEPVTYIDENNQPQTCGEYTEVTNGLTAWSSGWYVVEGNVTIAPRVTVSGDVKLILTDGCNLTVDRGIDVLEGNALTIYGQSGGTGRLEAFGTYNKAGIGGGKRGSGGSITINGGSITANGGRGGAGIGGGWYGSGGSITITGGTVIATGGEYGAGIGGGWNGSGGSITINGGSITANGGRRGAGIGGGRNGSVGSITITGGTVDASSSSGGAGIGGGYYSSGGSITITGGSITANGGGDCGDIGVGQGGGGITLSGSCGTVIRASAIWADTPDFNGIIYNGTAYQVYGNAVLEENLTIQPSETLTIPAGASLDCNGKLTNDGTILVESGGELVGTPTGSGTVKIVPTITTGSLPEGTVGTAYSQTLEATGDSPITWSLASGSTLPDGLTLSTDGKISGTPTTAGSYNFTVTAANDSGSGSKAFTLTVTQPVTGVTLNKNTLELYTGQSETLTATVQPSNATNQNVTWSSDKPEVATVEGGKVTAVAVGSATITVTTADGSKIATCQVTVNAQNLSAANVTLGTALTYTGKDQTQTIASVTLDGTTLKEGVDYTISGNTGKDAGTYTLTITGKGNYTGTLKVSFPIAKAPLTITGVDVQSKTYDGTTAATVTGVSFKGLVNGEALAMGVDYTATADFADASADTFKSVTGKVTLLSSTLGKNYVLSDASFLTSGDISAAASKLSFKVDRTKPVKGQYITFSVTPQIKGDNRSFLQRVLGINAPKVEFWANGTTKLGEVKVEEGKTSTFAYDTDKGGLKLGKNTITAEFTGDGNLKGCTESVVVYLHDSTTSAPTGDESNIQTWTAVLAVSAVALVGLGIGAVIYRKKKK